MSETKDVHYKPEDIYEPEMATDDDNEHNVKQEKRCEPYVINYCEFFVWVVMVTLSCRARETTKVKRRIKGNARADGVIKILPYLLLRSF
jgi:hypothetical protein